MDLEYSAQESAFRSEVAHWIGANLPGDIRDKVSRFEEIGKEDIRRWHRTLATKGWIAPHWPVAWGGTGWDVVQRYIFEEECGHAGAPQLPGLALVFCASVLIRFGTEAQKRRFLPRIHDGSEFWCQGYSEPGSGSDLASLQTKAVLSGDAYLVSGQKIWTTQAEWADWMFALVRTGDEGKPQDGISMLLIDMRSPGIEVRPLRLMDGGYEVNEVFLDQVRVPAENLVHEQGRGWTVAKFLLGHERVNNARVGIAKRTLAAIRRFAGARHGTGPARLENPRFRDRLAMAEIELIALEVTSLRVLDRMKRNGGVAGPEVSMLKIRSSELHQTLAELLMDAAGGPQGRLNGCIARYLNTRKLSIYGGTNEIQRNIVAKTGLGL